MPWINAAIGPARREWPSAPAPFFYPAESRRLPRLLPHVLAATHVESLLTTERRAWEIFVSLLDKENRERFGRSGFVLVTGSCGGRYRIRNGYIANVDCLCGPVLGRLCAHPHMFANSPGFLMPIYSAMTVQLLKILTDEAGFLAVAHRA